MLVVRVLLLAHAVDYTSRRTTPSKQRPAATSAAGSAKEQNDERQEQIGTTNQRGIARLCIRECPCVGWRFPGWGASQQWLGRRPSRCHGNTAPGVRSA